MDERIQVVEGDYTCDLGHNVQMVKQCIRRGCWHLKKDGVLMFEKGE